MVAVVERAAGGAAVAKLAGGVVERYHLPHFHICHEPSCRLSHATLDELNTFEAE